MGLFWCGQQARLLQLFPNLSLNLSIAHELGVRSKSYVTPTDVHVERHVLSCHVMSKAEGAISDMCSTNHVLRVEKVLHMSSGCVRRSAAYSPYVVRRQPSLERWHSNTMT